MKKQIFIVAFVALALPTALCGYGHGGGSAPANPSRQVTPGPQPITSAAGLVAAYPNDADALVGGAVAGSGASVGSDQTNPAYIAAQAFVSTGSAPAPKTSNKSSRLGRLGK